MARQGWSGTFRPSIPAAQGTNPSLPLMSSPVRTAATPCALRAASVLIEMILAWPCGLRAKAMWSMPSSLKSSTKCPRPWINSGSSLRLIRSPRIFVAMNHLNHAASGWVAPAEAEWPLSAAVLNGPFNRFDDVLVSRAAAEVAFERMSDFLTRGMRVAGEQLVGRHDHSRCAEAAVQAVLLPESLLQGMEMAVGSEPLKRRHVRTVGLDGKDRAGFRGLSIQKHCAGAAQRSLASDVRSCQTGDLAQIVHKKQPRLDVIFAPVAVDVDSDFHVAASIGILLFIDVRHGLPRTCLSGPCACHPEQGEASPEFVRPRFHQP